MRGDAIASRRQVLRAVLAAPVVLAACTSTPPSPPPPDPLAALAETARSDAALAAAIAAAVPALATAAGSVSSARAEHAEALQREVDRERPPRTSASAPPSSTAPAVPADPGAALVTALTAAESSAAALVGSLPRYRAGLVGSVAAGCASLREVLA